MTESPPPGRGARRALLAASLIVATGIVACPPWRATAIRTTTTRYGGAGSAAPVTLVDTVRWSLSWALLAAPPRAPFTAADMRTAEERAVAGDVTARNALLSVATSFERRYGVPEILRAGGTTWRDSVLSTAGMPSVSAYDVVFAVDDARLAIRLAILLLTALLIDRRLRRTTPVAGPWIKPPF